MVIFKLLGIHGFLKNRCHNPERGWGGHGLRGKDEMQMSACGSEVEQRILPLSTSLRMRNFAMCFEWEVCAERYLTAKPARLAEDYRAIPLVPQALDAFGVTADCLRPRLISG